MTADALMEFLLLTVLAAGLGVGAHYWKTHVDPRSRRLIEQDGQLFSLGAGCEEDIEQAIWHPRYDEAGHWVGHSLRNLALMVTASLTTVYLARYALLDGFSREDVCSAFHHFGLTPLFCG